MLGPLTLLLFCQLAGELIARLLHLPVPGPVIGMVLLFAGLLVRSLLVRGQTDGADVPMPLQETAGGILRHLSLLFVPAGVGVMVHIHRLGAEALPIAAALFGSTLLGVALTAWIMNALMRRSASTDATTDAGPAGEKQ
jgi:Putative effector of murein hydrolase LrgA